MQRENLHSKRFERDRKTRRRIGRRSRRARARAARRRRHERLLVSTRSSRFHFFGVGPKTKIFPTGNRRTIRVGRGQFRDEVTILTLTNARQLAIVREKTFELN